MENFQINYSYMTGQVPNSFKSTGETLPSSMGIAWSMRGSYVHRIFNKEDLKELLFRMAIIFNTEGFVERWFTNDRILIIYVDGIPYSLTVEDLIAHFGAEVCDSLENFTGRDVYLQRMREGKLHINHTGLYRNHEYPEDFSLVDYIHQFLEKVPISEIDDALIAKAEFFADDVMKFIPDETFNHRNRAMIDKEREIAERVERIKNLPVFDINRIPRDTVFQCLEIMYANTDNWIENVYDSPKKFEEIVRPMIYLAWLYANDFIVRVDGWPEPAEGFELDVRDYELEDGGSNLDMTIMYCNIEDTVPLLKGVLF